MNELRNQIARAQRRLVMEQFLGRCVWCLSAALAMAVVAIAAPRLVTIDHLPANWDVICLVAAVIGGIVAAALWTAIAHRSALDAAIEIDHRFNLRERIASSLSLSESERQTEAGHALVKDAIRAASRLDVGDKFRLRLRERAWLPLIPAALAFLMMIFFNPATATSSLDPNSPTIVAKQINTANESLRKKMEQPIKEAQRRDLKEAANLFKKIETETTELAKQKDLNRTKAAVKLNNLANQLAERRKQLGGKEGLQKQLQNMKSFDHGPADKIAEAMKQGDFQQAAEQLEKLAQQLRDGNLDPQQKAELAKQLQQLKQQLADAAQAHQQAMENLQKQIEQARAVGDLAKAGELQQKLDQLADQSPQMDGMQSMCDSLGEMQQCLKSGDSKRVTAAMKQMADQLSQMQQEASEMEMLDMALDELQFAKDAMTCQSCQGGGCKECQVGAAGMNSMSSKPSGGIGAQPGNHRANNYNPETESQKSQVRGKPGPGAAIYAGTIAGPNIKGNVQATIQQDMTSFTSSEADPLTTQELPRNRREHAEEYFNSLREGK
jgi:tetratricopeptide (TPR) repeat protein